MGKRGPKPMPTALHQLRGSWRGNARAAHKEPEPSPGRPRTPAWLDPVGKTAFRWVVRQLEGMGMLTLADAKCMERYAALYSRWRQAEKLVRRYGQVMLVRRADGSELPRKNPAVAIAADLSAQLGRLEASLGLSPAARVNLHATAQAAASGGGEADAGRKARFLSGGA